MVEIRRMSRRGAMIAAGVALGATSPLGRALAQAGSVHTVPIFVMPKLSAPLPDPLREGPSVFDTAPIDYVVEDRLMSGVAPIHMPVHEADVTIAPPPPGVVPNEMGGGGAGGRGPAGGAGVPVYNPFDFSPRLILSTAAYTTRVLIYRPRDVQRFSGNVIVETIHPSSGGHTPMWEMVNRFFALRGDVMVCVQHPRSFAWLKYHKPGRYDGLSASDFTQVWGMLSDAARLFKTGGPASPISTRARRAYLTGYSFTGLMVTTYAKQHHNVNRMPDGAPVFDGYPSGTGFGPMPPLDVPFMAGANQYATYNDTDQQPASTLPISSSLPLRQAFDADGPTTRRRRYEIVGCHHTPLPLAEPGSAIPRPRSRSIEQRCFYQYPQGAVPNPNISGRPVWEGIFRNISDWVDHNIAPPRAPIIETEGGKPKLDEYGNVRGGLRMPEITVPIASYAVGVKECSDTGWMLPFTPERLRQLYGNWATYLQRYNQAADKMVAERFILPETSERMKLAAARSVPDF